MTNEPQNGNDVGDGVFKTAALSFMPLSFTASLTKGCYEN